MPPVGGLRARFIHDSSFRVISQVLDDLGWLTPSSSRRDVELLAKPLDLDREILPNKVTFFSDLRQPEGGELGSNFSEFRWTHFIEIFGEDDSIGTALAYDLADALAGRMTSIGRDQAVIPVYDLSLATPDVIFTVDVEDVVVDRPVNFTRSWMRHMFSIRFDTVDAYTNEAG